ncbi:hypothetical protein NDU88_005057 [Pleurodeles waltl]|uniref:Uncharacterized protein n=1 Tax=Pleurodeles waltl TaxID=8319 RepID=A0AAV7QDY5_PLEWA|nr:hypothetical protein NDU88_005057 [Pleurodeles waltl]
MAPKLSRTPRSLRARQNQDPGGTRTDKKLPVPGLKEHSNPQVKGGLHKTTDMEKDTRYSVPTMFTSEMRLKQMSTEKAVCDSQSNVPGVNDEQILRVALQQVSGYRITQHVEENQSSKLMLGVVQGPSLGETRLSLKRRMVKCSGTIRPPDRLFRKVIRPSMGGPAEPPSLDLIYRKMVQNHEQAQRESRKMKAANRQLQLSIKKVGKSCQDIGARIATMETRSEELEIEVKAATAQTTTQGQQISDIQWKLEDAENRHRRNHLRILGMAEDLEGQDTRAYIALLFKKSFPHLIGWDWERRFREHTVFR